MNHDANQSPLTLGRLHRQFLALQNRARALEEENRSLRHEVESHSDKADEGELMITMLSDACQLVAHLTEAKRELEAELDRLEAREQKLMSELALAQRRQTRTKDFNAVDQLKARLRAIREEKEARMAA